MNGNSLHKEVVMRSRCQLYALVLLTAILFCSAASATITGTVTGPDGSPIADALVALISEYNPINIFSSVTDYNGNYEISLETIAPPSNVILSDESNDNGHTLHLSWTLSPDDEVIHYYNIYRSRNPELTNSLGLDTFSSLKDIIESEKKFTLLIAQVPKGNNSFTDSSVPLSNTVYYYWIAAVSEFQISEKVSSEYLTKVNEQTGSATNQYSFSLFQNFPNPFNPSTSIPFNLKKYGFVDLSIYNVLGQKVKTLISGHYSEGSHTVTWNARNDSGEQVGAGIYIYQLRHESQIESNKMLLIDGGGAHTFNSLTKSFYHTDKLDNTSISNANKIVSFPLEKVAENITYHITITGENIETYEESGVTIVDGNTYDFFVNRIIKDITFRNIPGGTFQMGDEDGEWSHAMPVHTVTLSSFELSTTEITNDNFAAYLNEALASGGINEPSGGIVTGKTGDYNGQEYIDLSGLNSDFSLNECWIRYRDDTFVVESGYENWPVIWVTWYGAKAYALYYGLDLPTEAEWEYSARGEKQYRYGTDDGMISTSNANYRETVINHPVEVGKYPTNPFGINDLSGNVWEWCNDWYDDYISDSVTNPTGGLYGSDRVRRGGGWGNNADYCRTAHRSYASPGNGGSSVGFRVVRRPGGVTY